jgi:hypothetical protein
MALSASPQRLRVQSLRLRLGVQNRSKVAFMSLVRCLSLDRRSTLARRRRDQGEVVEACPGAANHPVISFVPHETPPLLSLRAGGETFAIRCISRGLRMQPLNAEGPGTLEPWNPPPLRS